MQRRILGRRALRWLRSEEAAASESQSGSAAGSGGAGDSTGLRAGPSQPDSKQKAILTLLSLFIQLDALQRRILGRRALRWLRSEETAPSEGQSGSAAGSGGSRDSKGPGPSEPDSKQKAILTV